MAEGGGRGAPEDRSSEMEDREAKAPEDRSGVRGLTFLGKTIFVAQ